MKWFKHETDADKSEGIDALMAAEGFAGYGRWNRLLEIVAFKMDKTDRCHAEYSISKWCSLLGLKQKKLKTFLELTENKLKTKVVYCENIIRIEIPNLLNKRDNYTKDLEVPTKKLPSKEVEVEVEVDKEVDIDIDIDKDKKTPLPPFEKGAVVKVEKPVSEKPDSGFETFWQAYPKKIGKGLAQKSFLRIKPNEKLLETMIAAIASARESEQWKKDGGQFIPFPSTWLNQERWGDEHAPIQTGSDFSRRVDESIRLANEIYKGVKNVE